MNTLAERIKIAREQKGMSQDELARLTAYTSRSTISRIEKGEFDIPLNKINLFSTALGVTPEYLMGWDSKDATTEDLLLMEFRKLDMNDKENVINYIKNVLLTNSKYEKRKERIS